MPPLPRPTRTFLDAHVGVVYMRIEVAPDASRGETHGTVVDMDLTIPEADAFIEGLRKMRDIAAQLDPTPTLHGGPQSGWNK